MTYTAENDRSRKVIPDTPESRARVEEALTEMRHNAETAAPRRATIKRRFAVMLEDAFDVPVPDDIPDDEVEDWARAECSNLYRDACDGVNDCKLLWENEHKFDLDFPETEYEIEVQHIDGYESGEIDG